MTITDGHNSSICAAEKSVGLEGKSEETIQNEEGRDKGMEIFFFKREGDREDIVKCNICVN